MSAGFENNYTVIIFLFQSRDFLWGIKMTTNLPQPGLEARTIKSNDQQDYKVNGRFTT
jgi:hypothetical protein